MARSQALAKKYPHKQSMKFIWPSLLLAVVTFFALQAQAEVLGHISDETATPVIAEPAKAEVNDRRITYRVICDPEGEALPDCEQPFHDTETVAQPLKQQEEVVRTEVASEKAAVEPMQVKKPAHSKKTSRKKTAGSKKKPTHKSSKKSKSSKKTKKKSTPKSTTKKTGSQKK
jgi:hypothetical protein